jgi:hypothetical protein
MTGIQRYAEIWADAFLIGIIDRLVSALVLVRADVGHHMSAGRETEHADFVWIDAPFGCMQAHQSNRSLRVLQRITTINDDRNSSLGYRPPAPQTIQPKSIPLQKIQMIH